MADRYMTSIRNFGPAKPVKRAPVDAVDAKLEAAVANRDEICRKMAADVAQAETLMPALLKATEEISKFKMEREEIIRRTFCR